MHMNALDRYFHDPDITTYREESHEYIKWTVSNGTRKAEFVEPISRLEIFRSGEAEPFEKRSLYDNK